MNTNESISIQKGLEPDTRAPLRDAGQSHIATAGCRVCDTSEGKCS